MLESKL
jgi:hypothetical protein